MRDCVGDGGMMKSGEWSLKASFYCPGQTQLGQTGPYTEKSVSLDQSENFASTCYI